MDSTLLVIFKQLENSTLKITSVDKQVNEQCQDNYLKQSNINGNAMNAFTGT